MFAYRLSPRWPRSAHCLPTGGGSYVFCGLLSLRSSLVPLCHRRRAAHPKHLPNQLEHPPQHMTTKHHEGGKGSFSPSRLAFREGALAATESSAAIPQQRDSPIITWRDLSRYLLFVHFTWESRSTHFLYMLEHQVSLIFANLSLEKKRRWHPREDSFLSLRP